MDLIFLHERFDEEQVDQVASTKICRRKYPKLNSITEYSFTRLNEGKHVFKTAKFIVQTTNPRDDELLKWIEKIEPSVNFEGPWIGPNFDAEVVPCVSLLADNVIHFHKLQPFTCPF